MEQDLAKLFVDENFSKENAGGTLQRLCRISGVEFESLKLWYGSIYDIESEGNSDAEYDVDDGSHDDAGGQLTVNSENGVEVGQEDRHPRSLKRKRHS